MAIATFLKLNKIPVLFSVLCAFFYASFAYDLDRTDFIKLAMLYGALFFLSYKLVQICRDNFRFLVYLSVAFRLVFIFSIPNLSQDFYRFVWDGR
ncbi:MAG TPA: mannosyltransferase, partial [Aquaticitalea sp.]|nr:mannosyltransferase [Aquaticitalea sp.]